MFVVIFNFNDVCVVYTNTHTHTHNISLSLSLSLSLHSQQSAKKSTRKIDNSTPCGRSEYCSNCIHTHTRTHTHTHTHRHRHRKGEVRGDMVYLGGRVLPPHGEDHEENQKNRHCHQWQADPRGSLRAQAGHSAVFISMNASPVLDG